MNYTANIQNFLEKNEAHCIFLSNIHQICNVLQFLFFLRMYGSYSSYHFLRSLEVIANSLLGCIFSYKAYGFNFSNFFKFFNFPICES